MVTFGVLVLPNEPWPDLATRWRRLDEAGVDSIWSCDHFTNPHKPGEPWFEGWTGLAGLAAGTKWAKVGLLVGAIVSRPPTLLAKQAQTVDHLTDGRLIVGLGAGGAPTDQPMWGVEDWQPAERAARFGEYVDLVDQLLRENETTFDGAYYRTAGAAMAPGFIQRPRPPLLLAAHGPTTLATAARFADIWNCYGPTLDDARRSSDRLDEACAAIHRDPAEITRSVLLGLTEGTAWTSAGEFEEVARAWHAAGFTDLIFYAPPYSRAGVRKADPAVVDEVLADVLPRLHAEL